jgi:cell division protein FtsA
MGKRKEQLYAAIDVGTTKTATLVAKVSATGSMEVVAVGHATSEGMRKGLVVSPEELGESVRRSVDEATAMLGKQIPPAYVGVTGAHLVCLNAVASMGRQAGKRGKDAFTQAEVDRLLMSTPRESGGRRLVHVIPRAYEVDGQSGIKDPVGLSGTNLSAESHVVLGDEAPLDNLARVVRGAGVKVRGMVLEHLASAEAVLTMDERQAGAVLVDIGGGTSDIAIYKDGAAWYTAALPVAGMHFTSDLAVALGLPPSVAESTKLEHGSALVTEADRHEAIAVSTGMGEHTRDISHQAVNQLLHGRAVELVRLILHKVADSGLDRVPLGGIVLTGGSANLPGLAEIVAEYGDCRVRVGRPSPALGLPEELQRAAFSTAVGLVLWGVGHRHAGGIAPEVQLSPSVMGWLRGWFSKLSLSGDHALQGRPLTFHEEVRT